MPATSVVGTDGKVPLYDPEGRWTIWSINEIWKGNEGQNRYVPKVKDYVIDPDTYTMYIVDALDPVTLVPTLREIKPGYLSDSLSQNDILLGVDGHIQSDTYRAYIDKTVLPYSVALDDRLKVSGSMTDTCKVYVGADTSDESKVISAVYSGSMFVSNTITLETVSIDNVTNYAIKKVPPFKTTYDLTPGELITAVFYDDAGHVIYKRQMLVEETTFIERPGVVTKYITHISLESPFLSPSDDFLIEFPLNLPVNAMNLIGVVHYSDGTQLKLPVDGSRFAMLGLSNYVSSIPYQEADLVLRYTLSANESSYAPNTVGGNYITLPYKIRTVDANYTYCVKLFPYPEWKGESFGYRLKWYLLSLERNVLFEVTDKVEYNPTTGAFDPKAYGVVQRKEVSINLKNVSPLYGDFRHVQIVDITLYGAPSTSSLPWTVSNEPIKSVTYGDSRLFATRPTAYTLNINGSFTDLNEWLDEVYYKTLPLKDGFNETDAPAPSLVEVHVDNQMVEIPVTDFQNTLTFTNVIDRYDNAYLVFKRQLGSEVQYLSVAAIVIK